VSADDDAEDLDGETLEIRVETGGDRLDKTLSALLPDMARACRP
jgi:hypothetical protein